MFGLNDDFINEIQADELRSGDYYDTIPFGDAIRFEDEAVAQDLSLGEGLEDCLSEEDLNAQYEAEYEARMTQGEE